MTLMARIEKVWAETKPWTKNFTLYTQRWTGPADYDPNQQGGRQVFRPYWVCNNENCGQIFCAAREAMGAWVTVNGRKKVWDENIPSMVWDETCGPQMNEETLHECPYCN